jgi:hypothetical protein
MNVLSYEYIENLRVVAGTLPSETPKKNTKLIKINDSIEVEMVDHNLNPYKAMFLTATATWGNNEYANKWNKTFKEGKFEVIKAVLSHNTLPQAREVVNFIFRVKGVPRWLFDEHTQVKFMTIMSIGCRDNNKLDADIITESTSNVFLKLKDLYEETLNKNGGSWQVARAFLSQSYSHSYFFAQNLLAISNAINFNSNIKNLYLNYIIPEIENNFPLLGDYLNSIWDKNLKNKFFEKLKNMKYNELSELDKKYFGV